MGWTLTEPPNGMPVLFSPVGNKRIGVPTEASSIKDRVLTTWGRQLLRYGDPEKVRAWVDAQEGKPWTEEEKAQHPLSYSPTVPEGAIGRASCRERVCQYV